MFFFCTWSIEWIWTCKYYELINRIYTEYRFVFPQWMPKNECEYIKHTSCMGSNSQWMCVFVEIHIHCRAFKSSVINFKIGL